MLCLATVAWAYFIAHTGNPSSFATGDVEGYVPASVTASWASPTTCQVSWTPEAGVPGSTVYDVTDGAGNTLTTGVSGTSTTVTVVSTAITPTVRARIGTWVSTAQTTAAAPGCRGVPGPPTAVGATAGDTTSVVSWTAPALAGSGAITSYTATAVPAGGALPTRTCTAASSPCTLTGLTNGMTYTVSVTATNAAGTGNPSTATAVVPYPTALFTSSDLRLWLDAQHSASLSAAADCSGSGAGTGTGIGCWKDRSGNGWNAPRVSASGAVLTAAALGGHPALRFVKTDPNLYRVTAAGIGAVGSADRSVFAAAHARTTYGTLGANKAAILAAWGTWNNGLLAQTYGGTTTIDTLQGDFYNSTPSGVFPFTALTGPAVMSGIWSSSGGTLTGGVAVNGTGTLSTASLAGAWYGSPNSFQVGAGDPNAAADYAYPLDGDVGEVLVFDRALSASERRVVEEYLARRWDLTIAPAAPTSVTGTRGDSQVAVSWAAPAWNGGAAVTSYAVTAAPGGATCTTASTGCTVAGLVNGTPYTFTVTATNAAGTGPASAASAPVTPATTPGAPTGVAATTGDTTSSVSWSAPASDGGSAITSYTATAVPSDGSLPTRTCTAASSPCTLTTLTNGARYSVTVVATNGVGNSASSSAVTVIPYPSGVLTGAAVKMWLDGADSSTLYAASTCTGAAATTTVGCWKDKSSSANHATQASAGNQPVLGAIGSHTAPTFDGTDDGATFNPALLPTGTSTGTEIAVAALTDAVPSSTGWRTLFNYGTASTGQKRFLGKEGSSDQVWFDTHGNGSTTPGSWVTGQPAVVLTEAASANTRSTMNGKAWTAQTAVAFNTGTTLGQLGFGAVAWKGPIAEVIVLNAALSDANRRQVEEYLARKWGVSITPSASTAVVADDGDGEALVTWTAPSWNGGSPITGYTVTSNPGGKTCTIGDDDGTSCTVTGLTNGTAYTFTVTAANAVGTGPASAASNSVTPLGPPGAPTGVAATAADTTSSVSWSAPASNGGSAITSYTARAVPSDGSLATRTCSAAASPCTLTGLTNGATYTVTVKATNALGTSAASTSTTVIPYPAGVMTGAATKLWLDGADGSTLFASNACSGASATTTVGCWKDKSASATNATQGTAANQPTLTTANGRSVPGFDGTNDYVALANANSLPTGSTTSTTFLAAALADASPAATGYRAAFFYGTNVANQGRTFGKWTNSANAGLDSYSTGPITLGPWTSAVGILVGEHGASVNRGWLNGGVPVSAATTTSTATTTAVVGRQSAANGLYWNGAIPEVIVLSGALTDAQRRSVEEYLARKWGTTLTPSAPASPSVVAGVNQATVSWSAPSWNGGSAVTSYTVTTTPGGATCTIAAPTTSCTVTGLTNENFGFTVTASNAVGTGPPSTAVTARPTAATAIALYAWGSQIGTSPVPEPYGVYSVTTGTEPEPGTSGPSGCAIRTDGTLWCAGVNSSYQLGDGTNTARATPVQIGAATTWAQVSMGRYHTCGVRTDGTLWCWGSNASGGLGVGDTVTRTTPAQVAGTTWASVSAGWDHTCAVKTDGTLWCWGENGTNAVGDSSSTDRWSPVQVGTAATWAAASAGWEYTCATRTDLTLWCWGENFDRQLGDGTQTNRSTPTQIGVGAAWAWVDTGHWHTCATRTNGTLWCWGANADGELGLGNHTNQASPTQVGALNTWSRPGLGQTHTCATRTDGTLWCWGSNASGEVGDGTTTERTSPVQIGSATTWSAPSAGGSVSYAGQPPTAPGAPTAVAATAADTTSSVSWTAPAPSTDGGATITSYTASAIPADGSLPTRTCSAASSPCTVTGLTNGVTYTVTVTATNATGTGAASTATSVIPYPAGVMTGAATKLWLDGADTLTLYAANTCSGAAATTTVGCWKDKSASTNNATQGTAANRPTLSSVTGRSVPGFDGTNDQLDLTPGLLPNGTTSSTGFVVAALTDPSPGTSGWRHVLAWGAASTGHRRGFMKQGGAASAVVDTYLSGSVYPGTWTSGPGILVGEMAAAQINGWFNGLPGAGPVGYAFNTSTTAAHVGREVSDPEFWQGPITEVIVLNTTVTATDRRKVEEYLARKWGVTITAAAPASASAAAGVGGAATVTFTAPAWNGGAAVTSYSVAPSSGAGSCTWSAGLTATCTGLGPGQSYTFTAKAVNAVGTGPATTTNSITP